MLVDSHCHLDFPDYAGQVDNVVARAGAAGVGVCLTIGTELKRFPGVRAVAEKFPNVWCSVGVHPHEAEKELLDDEAALIREAAHPKVVGIGETGLDYYYEHSPRQPQQAPAGYQQQRPPQPAPRQPQQAPAPAPNQEYRPRQAELDPHGRVMPREQRHEDDQLEIPAFLRRQAN